MLLKRGSIPLHYQLRERLRNRIVRGEYRIGEQFPTEKELLEEFGVSQTTVRRALSELSREGILERIPGKGTFVRSTCSEMDLGPLASFSQEMSRRNHIPSNNLIRAEVIEPPHHIIEAMQLEGNKLNIFCLERVRLIDNSPLIHETAYLPMERFPGIEEINWELTLSLLEVLLDIFHIQCIEIGEIVEPVLITEYHASLLQVEPFTPALHLSSSLLTYNRELIQYSDAIIPRQRARYQVLVKGGQTAADEPSTLAGRSLSIVQPE